MCGKMNFICSSLIMRLHLKKPEIRLSVMRGKMNLMYPLVLYLHLK